MMVQMPINRKWFFVLMDGSMVLDWGQGLAQDIITGSFMRYIPKDYSHAVEDNELNTLVEKGRVVEFDNSKVVLLSSE